MARVLVVGAGVVGLSCAVRLLESGHRVDVVARDLPLETVSAVAAARWYPYRAYPLERVTAWSARSYTEFASLADVAGTGVRMREGTELHRARAADPWWMNAVPTLTRVRAVAPPYVEGWSYVAPVVEMPVYLRWLTAPVETLGGTLTRMPLGGLSEHVEVVVNASGLGARLMAEDTAVSPVRGRWCSWSRSASTGGGSTAPVRYTSCRARGASWSAAPTRRGSGTAGQIRSWPS